MRTVTFYFTPATNTRLARIKVHLPGLSLSQVIAVVLSSAERALAKDPTARPWVHDVPSTEAASRHTLYLQTRSEERLETLRHEFQQAEGPSCAILRSVVVARAIALAEPQILALSSEDLEVLRIRSDAAAIENEVIQLADEESEKASAELLKLLQQAAGLFTRAQRVQQATAHTAGSTKAMKDAWVEASQLQTGTLNDLMNRITESIKKHRQAADARARR